MATNFRVKMGKSADSFSFVVLAFKNGPDYRHSDCKKFICDDLATLRINLVNFGSISPECKKVVGVHPLI